MYRGLSDSGPAIVGTVGSTTGAIATSTGIFGAFEAGSLAIPVIGAAIAGVTALVGFFMAKNAQYHAQETASTQIVDQAEQLMKQNLAAWNASSKTASEQAAAEQNFANVWGQVVQACNNAQLGDPGQRCIKDRSRGGQWDWFAYYYDPIANDPNVQPDPVSGALAGAQQALLSNPVPALLLAGLVAAAVWS